MNAKTIAAVGDRGVLAARLALIILLLPASTRAAEVRIPLTIRFDLLTQQLSEQLYTQAGHNRTHLAGERLPLPRARSRPIQPKGGTPALREQRVDNRFRKL